MKNFTKIYLVLSLVFASQLMFAQQIGNLDGISYQAVAIDDTGKEIVGMDINGKPLYEKTIGVRFSILKGVDGDVLYQETHSALTDKYGLFSLTIGHGEQTGEGSYDNLLDMPWIDADQYLKVEISIANDDSYKMVSLQKFMTVPYSFYTDDIADNAITTAKILDETILPEDIGTGSVETSEILDETILAEDIGTGSVETSEILDETIQAEDIDTGAVTTSEILDETILAEDIGTGSVETSEILDETILAEDIGTGSVETSEILNETILAEDIGTGSVETSEILDGTILNEDIANGTIDLTTKVTGVLPVADGGTGLDGSGVLAGQILIGNGTGFTLDSLTAGTGINITNTAGGITISSGVTGVNSVTAPNVSPGSISAGSTFISGPLTLTGVVLGNIIVGSIDGNLKGCMMTCYVSGNNQIRVAIFNGTGSPVNFNANGGVYTLRVLVVQ
ncbi:MAG: hypothetical protein JKY53_07335 [Flavobacteriales bacterium]|nr:hypothetical protein [Flavobacteriales bacterium]